MFNTGTVGQVFEKWRARGLTIRWHLTALFTKRHFAAKFCTVDGRDYGHCAFSITRYLKQRCSPPSVQIFTERNQIRIWRPCLFLGSVRAEYRCSV